MTFLIIEEKINIIKMGNAIRNTLIFFFFRKTENNDEIMCMITTHTADICLTRMKGFKITCSLIFHSLYCNLWIIFPRNCHWVSHFNVAGCITVFSAYRLLSIYIYIIIYIYIWRGAFNKWKCLQNNTAILLPMVSCFHSSGKCYKTRNQTKFKPINRS